MKDLCVLFCYLILLDNFLDRRAVFVSLVSKYALFVMDFSHYVPVL